MLSMQQSKNGGVAIVFGKEHAELAVSVVYPMIAAKIFGIRIDNLLEEPAKPKTLDDIKSKVETSDAPTLRLTLPQPSATGRAQRVTKLSKESLRNEIAKVMYSIEETKEVHKRTLYYELYERFRQVTGIEVKDIKQSRSDKGKGGLTKLDTLVNEGHGDVLINLAHEIYDKYFK
jgi:hypothetical protein